MAAGGGQQRIPGRLRIGGLIPSRDPVEEIQPRMAPAVSTPGTLLSVHSTRGWKLVRAYVVVTMTWGATTQVVCWLEFWGQGC